jgi:hypothetical protein
VDDEDSAYFFTQMEMNIAKLVKATPKQPPAQRRNKKKKVTGRVSTWDSDEENQPEGGRTFTDPPLPLPRPVPSRVWISRSSVPLWMQRKHKRLSERC